MKLEGKKIFLRPALPSDADVLYDWENNKDNWPVSGTKKPFTKKEIKDFISNQKDIYLDKQLRLMISLSSSGAAIGCIDLFEFDERALEAGVGILVEKEHRKKGYASDALAQLIHYSFKTLNLRKLYCTITEDNQVSMKLFRKHQFQVTDKKEKLHSLQLENSKMQRK